MMFHRVLDPLVDEISQVSSVEILVLLRTTGGNDAWTNELYDRIAQGRMVMMNLRAHPLFVLLLKGVAWPAGSVKLLYLNVVICAANISP